MRSSVRYPLMVLGMIVSWSAYYAVSKILVDATGSAVLTGAVLRTAALGGIYTQMHAHIFLLVSLDCVLFLNPQGPV